MPGAERRVGGGAAAGHLREPRQLALHRRDEPGLLGDPSLELGALLLERVDLALELSDAPVFRAAAAERLAGLDRQLAAAPSVRLEQ